MRYDHLGWFARGRPNNVGNPTMLRVNGYYLYQVAQQIAPLGQLADTVPVNAAWITLYVAESAIAPLLSQSVFALRTSVQSGEALLAEIRRGIARATGDQTKATEPYGWQVNTLKNALRTFETVLGAELSLLDLYIVSQKGAYVTTDLIANGQKLFPADLVTKAPLALPDVLQGAKCIAFDLPTAAGFHLHRANESVLHRYYDEVTKGKPRPSGRNIGEYLAALNQHHAGDPKVKSALKDLKDLHRNPLIHPEHSLDNIDDAVALLGGIHTCVVQMLKEIPVPTVPGTIASALAAALQAPQP